jgi:tRNA(Phe) wybutosine-synthesizing methylase Tyw3
LKRYMEFRKYRLSRLEILEKHIKDNRVDEELVDWLVRLNKNNCLITTSSCSGRLTVHIGTNPLDKRNSVLISSWHDPARAYKTLCSEGPEFKIEMENRNDSTIVWISLQPPIVHIISPITDLVVD